MSEEVVAFRTGQLFPSPSRPLALHLASSSGALRHGSYSMRGRSPGWHASAGAPVQMAAGHCRCRLGPQCRASEPCGSREGSPSATVQLQPPPLGSCVLAWARAESILPSERVGPLSQSLGRRPEGQGGSAPRSVARAAPAPAQTPSFPCRKDQGFASPHSRAECWAADMNY